MLSAVDQRSALNGHHAAVSTHLLVGTYDARLHVKPDLHLIALFPFAGNIKVAIVGGGAGNGAAVH